MAYFYFNSLQPTNSQSLISIVENSADKQYYVDQPNVNIIEVTSEDFIKIKSGHSAIVSYDGTNFTFVHDEPVIPAEERGVQDPIITHHNELSEKIGKWLEDHPEHPKTSEWTSYKNYLDNFDVSSVTWPLGKSWEEYCQDNSISYKSLLELPTK
jgi:hypothetical protein